MKFMDGLGDWKDSEQLEEEDGMVDDGIECVVGRWCGWLDEAVDGVVASDESMGKLQVETEVADGGWSDWMRTW